MLQIIGKEKINYVSKKTNKEVNGYIIHFLDEKKNCEGFCTSNVYVNLETYKRYFDVPLDSFVNVFYDRFGRIVGCELINKS